MKMNPGNAEHYKWGNNCDGWHFLKNDLLGVIQERVPAGCQEVRHFHKTSRQFFYILSGAATIEMNGTDHCLSSGEGIEVPPKAPHQFKNLSNEDVIFLVISSPNSHGDRVNIG